MGRGGDNLLYGDAILDVPINESDLKVFTRGKSDTTCSSDMVFSDKIKETFKSEIETSVRKHLSKKNTGNKLPMQGELSSIEVDSFSNLFKRYNQKGFVQGVVRTDKKNLPFGLLPVEIEEVSHRDKPLTAALTIDYGKEQVDYSQAVYYFRKLIRRTQLRVPFVKYLGASSNVVASFMQTDTSTSAGNDNPGKITFFVSIPETPLRSEDGFIKTRSLLEKLRPASKKETINYLENIINNKISTSVAHEAPFGYNRPLDGHKRHIREKIEEYKELPK